MDRWSEMQKDCESAIKVNSSFYKGYYLMGIVLAEIARVDSDKSRWMKLLNDSEIHFIKAIKAHSNKEEKTIYNTLNEAIRKSRSIKVLKGYETEKMEKDEQLIYCVDLQEKSDKIGDKQETDDTVFDLKYYFDLELQVRQANPPDFVTCPITLEPLQNPSTTPDGISYDKCSIEEMIARGNFVDPTTRNKFKPTDLVENYKLKELAAEWVNRHPEHEFGSNYQQIKF